LPITIAHPAVVIPFQKLGLPLSALVIGSMMPDFEFFLRISSARTIGHTIPGIFLFCLPLGLIFLFLFHYFLKKPILSLLPTQHSYRISGSSNKFSFLPLNQFFKINLALLLGIISHLVLDSATHDNSFFTNNIPFLCTLLFSTQFGGVRIYFLLQHVISIVGCAFVIYWYIKWYRKIPFQQKASSTICKKHKINISLSILLFTLLTTIVVGPLITFSRFDPGKTEFLKQLISHSVIVTVTGFLTALFIYSTTWHLILFRFKKSSTDVLLNSISSEE
jgi:hypothetical protein